jgi:hypothetical protein
MTIFGELIIGTLATGTKAFVVLLEPKLKTTPFILRKVARERK